MARLEACTGSHCGELQAMIAYGMPPKQKSRRMCYCLWCCCKPDKGRERRAARREIEQQLVDDDQESYEPEDPALCGWHWTAEGY